MHERRPPVDATEKVLDAMKEAGEPVNAGKVVEMTGLERKEVDKAMNDLKKTERIVSPKRCYWEPKT
jgi:predicted Zn-ribbon and HTH transcriptional regulator